MHPVAVRLFTLKEACDFVRACDQDKNLVLGIERFVLDGSGFIPDLGGILDNSVLTAVSLPERGNQAALDFLSKYGRESSERFEITTERD
jgi:hypothetical protein